MNPEHVELSPQHEIEELPTYRRLSGMALGALILGLASPLAMVSPVLWLVPVIAIAVAIRALYQVRAEPDVYSGSGFAWIGLVLAVVFLAAAPARTVSREEWLDTRSGLFAQQWIDYLRSGQSHKAHQLHTYESLRLPLDGRLADTYLRDEEMTREFHRFLAKPPVQALLGSEPGTRVVTTEVAFGKSGRNDQVFRRYKILPPGVDGDEHADHGGAHHNDTDHSDTDHGDHVHAHPRPMVFEMIVERSEDVIPGRETWRVLSVNESSPPKSGGAKN